MKSIKKYITGFLLTALFSLSLLSGCKATNMVSADKAAQPQKPSYENSSLAASPESEPAKDSDSAKSPEVSEKVNRKIIKTASVSMETSRFDDTINALTNLVSSLSGYVENSSVSGGSSELSGQKSRTASYTVRIPSDRLDDFVDNSLPKLGNVLQRDTSSSEITDQYFDAEARLKSLKIQEERLLKILDKAPDLASVVELEKTLSETRYQIETLTGTLKKYDSLIDMSTVTISVKEVYSVANGGKQSGLTDRINLQFARSFNSVAAFGQNLIVFVLGNSPVIILIVVIVIVIFIIIKNKIRKNKPTDYSNLFTNIEKDDDGHKQ